MVRSLHQVDNVWKCGQELEIMEDGKYGGEFRRFGALSLRSVILWLFQ